MPKPRLTWRGILYACAAWLVFSFVGAIPVASNAHIYFRWALSGQLVQNLYMALLSIPVWLLLVRRMDHVRWPLRLGTHIVVGPLYAFLTCELYLRSMQLFISEAEIKPLLQVSQWIIVWNLLTYVIEFAVYHAVEGSRRLRFKERQMLELLALRKEQELSTLRSQINPHFLFNTLNSISALASDDPEGTRAMITRLGDMLRYTTETSTRGMVSLRDEVDFVKSYVALESRRFAERLQMTYCIEGELLDMAVPPMILQPLVENAIKHGIEPSEEGGEVILTIVRNGRSVKISVRDTGVGSAEPTLANSGAGIGLTNTDARLRMVFGDDAAVWTTSSPGKGFEAGFSLPLNDAYKP